MPTSYLRTKIFIYACSEFVLGPYARSICFLNKEGQRSFHTLDSITQDGNNFNLWCIFYFEQLFNRSQRYFKETEVY